MYIHNDSLIMFNDMVRPMKAVGKNLSSLPKRIILKSVDKFVRGQWGGCE